MHNRVFFPISVSIRFILAMLLPIQITLSSGVAGTYLSGFGTIWTLFDVSFQVHFLSIIIATLYATPAILFCVYFKYRNIESYPIKTALMSSILTFATPLLVGMLMPIDTIIFDYDSLMPLPIGYSVVLFLGFVLLPSLVSLIESSGYSVYSLEFIFSLIALLAGTASPFVMYYNHGVYASDQTLLSSIFITLSSIRSGWITESGVYFLHPTSVNKLDFLFVNFFVVLILRFIFLCFAIACFLGKTSVTRACLVGLVHESVLLVSSYLLNVSIPLSPYILSGTVPIPILFPLVLLMILIQRKIREPKAPPGEEFITISLFSRLKYQLRVFKSKLFDRRKS